MVEFSELELQRRCLLVFGACSPSLPYIQREQNPSYCILANDFSSLHQFTEYYRKNLQLFIRLSFPQKRSSKIKKYKETNEPKTILQFQRDVSFFLNLSAMIQWYKWTTSEDIFTNFTEGKTKIIFLIMLFINLITFLFHVECYNNNQELT